MPDPWEPEHDATLLDVMARYEAVPGRTLVATEILNTRYGTTRTRHRVAQRWCYLLTVLDMELSRTAAQVRIAEEVARRRINPPCYPSNAALMSPLGGYTGREPSGQAQQPGSNNGSDTWQAETG